MKLTVIGANIFIDLIKLQMLGMLFRIELEIYTAQELINQLNEGQIQILNEFIEAGQLNVHLLSETEFKIVTEFAAPRALDLADKTVAWLSLRLNALVISGDGLLRRFSESKNLEEKGIIWLFDAFVAQNLMARNLAAEKMNHLIQFNARLPKEEFEKRIKNWLNS